MIERIQEYIRNRLGLLNEADDGAEILLIRLYGKTDHCPRCGRNMKALGLYSDFVHYRADRTDQTPCLPEKNQGLDTQS